MQPKLGEEELRGAQLLFPHPKAPRPKPNTTKERKAVVDSDVRLRAPAQLVHPVLPSQSVGIPMDPALLAMSMANGLDMADRAVPALIPVVSAFKATKRTGSNSSGEIPSGADWAEAETLAQATDRNEIRRAPVRPNKPEQPKHKPCDDAPSLACSDGSNQVWLAVENSAIAMSGARTKAGAEGYGSETLGTKAIGDSTECMRDCLSPGCDSFTLDERERRCEFHSVGADFPSSLAPANKADFTSRAFHKFCFPGSLAPFVDCSEFLSFRDYGLDIPPREIFNGLPVGKEGLSACIELCVLSSEFRCKVRDL
jgi:hypothetical protein